MANPTNYGWEGQIWSRIKEFMEGNEYATAGWMGNLYAESFLIPYQLEKDYPADDPTHKWSLQFTDEFDRGKISREYFGTATMNYNGYGPGYGLAQWTYASRKKNLWDYWKNNYYGSGVSVGSINFQMAWFEKEVNDSFLPLKNKLLTVTSYITASDLVLEQYESPLTSVIEQTRPVRRELAKYYYEKYTGKTPDPDPPGPGPEPTPTTKKKFKWIYYIPRRY